MVKEYLSSFFNIFIVFESQKMGKKASLSKNKRAKIVILNKERFSQRKIYKKVFCIKTAVYQAIARFQIF